MSDDARFEDWRAAPLHLKAMQADDLPVLSALVQDAVFPAAEMGWRASERRFAVLLNRFRWEDTGDRGAPERVQSLLVIDEAQRVQSQGVRRGDADTVCSVLALAFEPGKDGTGRVILTLAGDGAIAVAVEALDVTLKDVTRPYVAPSRKTPEHPQ
ncbi:MAG: DUF2948 family protein [Rhodobacteraceae bacterium]|nr:DUF2948 family protein [Paracoccaceae bacterium]